MPHIWPPPFSIRISPKAKYARLRVLPLKGLEVVLPRGMDPATAMSIVDRHKDWVCKTLERLCAEGAGPQVPALPHELFLHGGTTRLPVRYGQRRGADHPGEVCVTLSEARPAAAAAALRAWVRGYAAMVLGEEAAQLAAVHGLPFTDLRFRRQKSRWGSCSARRSLNLNICLAFIPWDLARHVILHELAHTRHMDHGTGFWKTLFALEPDALTLDKRLRTAWRYVPAWVWL